MNKLLKRGLIIFLVLIGLAFVFGNYRIVQTDDGFHMMKKKEFGITIGIVDTRNWTVKDFLKNPEIGAEVGKLKLKNLQKSAERNWNKLSDKIDDMFEGVDSDLEEAGSKAKQEADKIRRKARKKYDQLVDDYKDNDINWDTFQKKLAELGDWAEKEIDKINN